jgi:hypothetical protein
MLMAHPKWSRHISIVNSQGNGHAKGNETGKASLTRSQLRQVLEVLGMQTRDIADFLAGEAKRLTEDGRSAVSQ